LNESPILFLDTNAFNKITGTEGEKSGWGRKKKEKEGRGQLTQAL